MFTLSVNVAGESIIEFIVMSIVIAVAVLYTIKKKKKSNLDYEEVS